MFPLTIGGLTLFGNGDDNESGQSNPVCECFSEGSWKFGLKIGFWEPARIIDTVKDAYCMMPLGMSLNIEQPYVLDGSHTTAKVRETMAQTHYYIYPVLALLDMYYDLPCLNYDQFGDVDIALISEVLPFWQNDMLAMIVNPEAVLFANPAAQLACLADGAAATAGRPLDPLYWCLGSWGTMFPLAGSASSGDMLEAHALLAMRTVQLMARSGALREFSDSGCSQQYTSVLTKSKYKMHMITPSRSQCFKPGESVLSWGNALSFFDNHSWMLFRKVNCCGY
ncbi:TraU family protein [Thalassotalea marina]|nr:TraU family protein [Thalassotalea marina]